ncbi:MAG: hypothetical protein ACRD1U_12135 [Vicinamibacterales bacterium]
MRTRHHIVAIACSIAFNGVHAVPGFAQSDMSGRPEVLTSLVLAGSAEVLRVYGHSEAEPPRAVLPPNLTFAPMYRRTIESMLERSPGFRRQSQRIALAEHLTVRLENLFPSGQRGSRARTRIARTPDGRLEAIVQLSPLDNLPELIAHELEHIIEQLDGVDLGVQASLPGTGVRTCDDGSFETIRAARVGTMVARQLRAR